MGEQFMKREKDRSMLEILQQQELMKYRLDGVAMSVHMLAGGFGSAAQVKEKLDTEDINRIFEELSENICRSCANCEVCWQEKEAESYEAICRLLEKGREKGCLEKWELPEYFMTKCINREMFRSEVNRCFSLAKLRMLWQNRMAESREAIKGQLEEVSEAIKRVRTESSVPADCLRVRKWAVQMQLRMFGIRVRQVIICDREGSGLEVCMIAKAAKGRCVTAKEAAGYVGKALGKRMIPKLGSKNALLTEYAKFDFCEEPFFMSMSGVARASRLQEETSGDNYSITDISQGSVLMLISDGMGTGKEAGSDSGFVVELLEQLLEAGFHEEAAIKLINAVLVLRSNQLKFSTVDLCMVNLYSGVCEFLKLGAAATYIKHESVVECICSTSLPAGVINTPECERRTKKLHEGDYVIMLSDGVADGLEGEGGHLPEVIAGIQAKNPQDMAERILNAALAARGFHPADDMTVLVTGIWRN